MLSTWSCDEALRTELAKEVPSEISNIDGKPIVTMSSAEYYLHDSDYIDKVVDRVSKSGPAVVEAMNGQIQTKSITDAVIIGLNDLRTTTSYKAKNAVDFLDDLSSHIRVVADDGSVEEFELVLTPHYNRGHALKAKNTALSTTTTWLALNPDIFYVKEDAQGNEIWPVTFPAVSLNNPDVKIEVTLDRDGTLTWPEKAKRMSAGGTSMNTNSELMYLDRVAIVDPCRNTHTIDSCDGGGGIGGGGPGGGDNYTPPDKIYSRSIPYLAIKTIRLDGTGDGAGGAELQMHVDIQGKTLAAIGTYDRYWDFVFDHKRRINNRPLWFDKNPFQLLLEGLKIYLFPGRTLLDALINSSIFRGRNTRTVASDFHVYETPDVNSELVNYSFTNMKTWEPEYDHVAAGRRVFDGYTYVGYTDYFPVVFLSDATFRLLLMEDDKKYSYASANGRSTLGHDVWTFNMETGSYEEVYTEVEAHNHRWGSSDDLMWHSGVSHINKTNVNYILNSQGDLKFTSPDDFMWEFIVINKDAALVDSDYDPYR